MDPRFDLDETRDSYDRVARRYAEEIAGELANKPFDRDFLDRFADRVRDKGKMAELGCGPAHVSAYLAERGVDMVGLDLSPAMVEEGRRLFPHLDVMVGDMLDLPFTDGSMAATIAFYSIIHLGDDQLRTALAEIARVLAPSGLAAFAFHVGDEVLHRDDWWGEPVSVDFRFLQPAHVSTLLAEAGLDVTSREERPPYPPPVEFQSRRVYLIAERHIG